MIHKIHQPTLIESAGNKPKIIEEFIGKVNSLSDKISIAKMTSPPGWVEPGQTPEFCEYTLVLNGTLIVKSKKETLEIQKGEAVIVEAGDWVQYNTPNGAEYIAVCLPAFSPGTVHRDKE
jgi:quercetin dioxygenase-like cupin family protein